MKSGSNKIVNDLKYICVIYGIGGFDLIYIKTHSATQCQATTIITTLSLVTVVLLAGSLVHSKREKNKIINKTGTSATNYNTKPAEIKVRTGPVKIPPEKVQGAFFKMMSMLEAHNLKQKYELGKLAVHLIHHMDKKGLLQENKDAKPSSRGVDKDPVASSQKIDGLYKKYTTSGFKAIESDLRAALKVNAGFLIDGLMYLAIGYQNVNLVKDLIKAKGGLILKTYDMYKFALATLVDENTEACEEIVDLISGPEAYTTPRNWVFRQLNFGFACLTVLDYIDESNYPMLKRSLIKK